MKIRIPDFDSGQISGVWIYQYSESSRRFEKLVQLAFEDLSRQDGAEVLAYSFGGFVDAEGNQAYLWAPVVRDTDNPDQVTLELWFPSAPPVAIRVSTYNAVGESPLSDEILYL